MGDQRFFRNTSLEVNRRLDPIPEEVDDSTTASVLLRQPKKFKSFTVSSLFIEDLAGICVGTGTLLIKVAALLQKIKNPQLEKASFDDFTVIGLLGTGAFGLVLKVLHKKTNTHCAMKVQSKKYIVTVKNQIRRLMNERNLLAATDFVLIVKLLFCFKDNANVYFILELMPCGDFFELKERRRKTPFNEDEARFYTGQVLLTFEYLHTAKIAFRDLKPENLLVAVNGYLKLTDFGYAKPLTNVTYTFCGTPEYMAPEVFTRRGYGVSVDWWAVGILIYEILFGRTPFADEATYKIYKRVRNDDVDFPKQVSKNASSIMMKLLIKDPMSRLGVQQNGAESVKQHPWFSSISWLALYERRYPPPVEPQKLEAQPFNMEKLDRSDVMLFEKEFEKF
ncbi:cAMP-dependent protein kinase catalytic subunit alpha-like [Tropilaelaps mercedesae]|uniref:cAMP-dependent protein kinase catalytic subunit alpha-like n=1 Tax=Tropilaelaps mercedesae TaxID=418985 RepID=A0A1V9XCH5_9ACAR|nr:cAMP-dependent protein kinase catalytic subunit alpha-like [Tropilaelaps mercedesae]